MAITTHKLILFLNINFLHSINFRIKIMLILNQHVLCKPVMKFSFIGTL